MTDKYNAIIESNHYRNTPKYWRVTIETNNIDNLNLICKAIQQLTED